MFSCGTVGDNNTSVGMVSMSAKARWPESTAEIQYCLCSYLSEVVYIYMYAFMCVRVCVCPQNGGKK